MDLQSPVSQSQINPSKTVPAPAQIRTMRGDLEHLSKTGKPAPAPAPVPPSRTKTTEAPEKLPVLPIKPADPDLPSKKIPEKSKEPIAKKNRRGLKWLIVLIVILFIGAGGFLYWWNYIYLSPPAAPPLTHFECQNSRCVEVEGQGENQCLTDADCLAEEPIEPETLIPAEETETIELSVGQETLFLEKLETLINQKQKSGSLKRILVKLINGEKKYASLAELISISDVKIPENILANLKNYTLFFYSQNQGPRLGLVIETTGEIKESLTDWEKSMADDLTPLLLDLKEPSNQPFQDNTYQNTAIRYLNLPDSYLTIDYGLTNNLLVIAFSKEAMYKTLDALSFAQD